MNLSKLFNIQAKLDERIVQEHNLQGQDLLDKKILALQVEVGELANEQRSWKFWSHDQRPRKEDEYLEYRPVDQGGNHWVNKNPLLEEYVDCLHFILSIGLDIGVKSFKPTKLITFTNDITAQFNAMFKLIGHIDKVILLIDKATYRTVMDNFLHLGEMLGFSWEQIEQAYLSKNQINHERQANGY